MRLFAAVILSLAAFAIQGPAPIPPCRGSECIDDVTHQHHDGPAWCQNYGTDAWAKNCACKRECDEEVGSGCVTYCRKKNCRCNHGCDSR